MTTIAPAIARYVDDIAFAADGQPAETPAEFADQLEKAAETLARAGIIGAEDLQTAATYLTDAMEAKGVERRVLLSRAVDYLKDTADIVDEYRLML